MLACVKFILTISETSKCDRFGPRGQQGDRPDVRRSHSSYSNRREAATLRDDKTDRAALADMLGELAMRLRGDVPSIPNHQEGG